MPNPDRLRCPECRTRRTDPRSFLLHVMGCTRALCHCGSYTYPHRPGSGMCAQNPEAQLALALRVGEPDDLLDLMADIAWNTPGKTRKVWPYEKHGAYTMREAKIEEHLVERVKALGGEIRKVKWVGRSRAPDRRVMLPRPGFPCWVELKNPETILTFPADALERAQAREHARMRKHGEIVHVIGTIEQVEALLS